ncbi:MAG: glycosyltransferase family 39 protein [Acidobacteriota bacterium]|nr:glycosyltransferase family 39 protein [Acidobacteriota bacterium]
MEARTGWQQNGRLGANLALIGAAVLLLRVPFLTQAVQGDDPYFLASAEHAQIDPLHPNHTTYVFEGRNVDFRGFPHPPLNAWILAGLIAAFGDIREIPFHAAYIVFSLIAAVAMYALGRKFSPRPVWATLLFLAVPAFVVNGNSFEADVPFLAFWTAGIACFVWDRLAWAAVFLLLASLTAFQAVLAVPILVAHLCTTQPLPYGHGSVSDCRAVTVRERLRHIAPKILVAATPIFGICAWQLFEFLTSGQFPFTIALGYHHNFDRLALKLRNAEMLSVHACWIVCPLLLPPAIVLAWKRRDRDTLFLVGWIVVFFCGALAFFYSGAARYLLPMAPAVALLVSRLRPAWLATGFALQLALSIALASVNYQHWDAYRAFAASLKDETARHRTWVNGEWGLRYYLEAEGALPLHLEQWVPTGDVVVTSELAYPVPYRHGGRALVLVAQREIEPSLPLRLIGLHARSGYSTADKGLLPFDISASPIDEVRAEILEDRAPVLSDLHMNAPEAEQQILFGISKLEENRWRWMEARGAVSLKAPAQPLPVRVAFFIPEQAPARTVAISVDGKTVASQTFPGPGSYVMTTSPQTGTQVGIAVDKTFTVPGDSRQLGLILTEIGFRK